MMTEIVTGDICTYRMPVSERKYHLKNLVHPPRFEDRMVNCVVNDNSAYERKDAHQHHHWHP